MIDISIQIGNNVIERVKEKVFFGVILDEHLSWRPHILRVSGKNIKINRSSFCLPKTSLHALLVVLSSLPLLNIVCFSVGIDISV